MKYTNMKKNEKNKGKSNNLKRNVIIGAVAAVLVIAVAIVACVLLIKKDNSVNSGELSYAEQHALLDGHGFLPQWSTDADYHWHDCMHKTCTEIIDKGEHTWDKGTYTIVPTVDFDGEIKYVCTTCQRSKTETVTYEQIRWDGKFTDTVFENFTFHQIVESPYTNADGSATSRFDNSSYSITKDKGYLFSYWSVDGSPETLEDKVLTADEIAAKRTLFTSPLIALMSDLSKFDYDITNDMYIAKEDMTADIAIDGTNVKTITIKDLTVDFYLKNVSDVTFSYMDGDNEIKVVWHFYHFGTTVVNS